MASVRVVDVHDDRRVGVDSETPLPRQARELGQIGPPVGKEHPVLHVCSRLLIDPLIAYETQGGQARDHLQVARGQSIVHARVSEEEDAPYHPATAFQSTSRIEKRADLQRVLRISLPGNPGRRKARLGEKGFPSGEALIDRVEIPIDHGIAQNIIQGKGVSHHLQ